MGGLQIRHLAKNQRDKIVIYVKIRNVKGVIQGKFAFFTKSAKCSMGAKEVCSMPQKQKSQEAVRRKSGL